MSPPAVRQPAATDPVARVMVDVPLAHLDRPFDYLIPTSLDETARPGVRVRVRFAGRLVDAYLLERTPGTAHEGRLAYIERVVGEPVLTPETTRLFRAVADRWAGSFADVARLGVPPRHARAEAAPVRSGQPDGEPRPPATVEALPGSAWNRYRSGLAFLTAVEQRKPARAVWSALPGEDWAGRLSDVVARVLADGRGAVVVVPDARDLTRLAAALSSAIGPDAFVALSADLGPAERYRRWLAVRRGSVRVAIGTRAAAYAPVADLGLLAIWDDGDDLHAEPRAPYPHARDVLVLRSSLAGAALLVGAHARTAEAQLLVESGWAHSIVADRATVRACAPRVTALGDAVEQARDPAAVTARLPSLAYRAARTAVEAGSPVLVQVPRQGYVPVLACASDRTPARCPVCSGPLAAHDAGGTPSCRWCGRPAADWACPVCRGHRMRAVVVGARRTAEELGRAFPGLPVRASGADRILDTVPVGPQLVVATPGAEPAVEGGYGAVLLLDGWAMLSRPDLRAAEETLRRWANASALARPRAPVVVTVDAATAVVQALVRWDPVGHAARELAERTELGFPPAVRMAAVSGAPAAVADILAAAALPEPHEVIGPVPLPDGTQRSLIRVARPLGAELASALHAAAAVRSARKAADPVRVVLDPQELA